MNRRDTIIVAVLLNAAIIAVLLIMAVSTDEEIVYDRPNSLAEIEKNSATNPLENKSENTFISSTSNGIVVDLEAVGFDRLLSDFSSQSDDFFLPEEDLSLVIETPPRSQTHTENNPLDRQLAESKVVDIVVKKGDSLDKIARANGTSVEAIKRLNQLLNERLSIGQTLRVPVGVKNTSTTTASKPTANQSIANRDTASTTIVQTLAQPVYYVIKQGDNPWKIAKQQNIKMEDLLRLNSLNEEKARNMKVGDKIRIR